MSQRHAQRDEEAAVAPSSQDKTEVCLLKMLECIFFWLAAPATQPFWGIFAEETPGQEMRDRR